MREEPAAGTVSRATLSRQDHRPLPSWVSGLFAGFYRYAPILSQRIRCEMRKPNRSWRVDETYVRVAGRWAYLYRAVDSEGNTIDFMLSPNRDLTAAKHFLQLALWRTREMKSSGELGRRSPNLFW